MVFFELITFTARVRTVAQALACIENALAAPGVGGTLMGCWASEIGQLNQITVLRGFADEPQLRDMRSTIYLPAAFSPLQ